ncbi:MAG: hypothetical protein NT099_08460 [Candidatus Saganbacteria bacterium]|nr:hypothetical protein [Candidatus Saganbacteria bacterium]
MNEAIDQSLQERNKITLAYIELGNDPVFKKLPVARQQELILAAIKIGKETAHWLQDLYQESDPRKIAQAMKIRVRGDEVKGKKVKSFYDPQKEEIVIYRNVVDGLLRTVDLPGFSENILKIFVALELFKYLEKNKIGVVYKKFELPGFKLGPFESKKNMPGLSLVASYAFIWTLLKLPMTAANFDYLVYVLFTKD